ncbi:MAG: DUF1254 domain-containing protein [Acidobacteria bacterium]|nr:MAG: DUF1254 domain-containing protein [Acidobacteriota bacterium]
MFTELKAGAYGSPRVRIIVGSKSELLADAELESPIAIVQVVHESHARLDVKDRASFEHLAQLRSHAHWDYALRLDANDPDSFWNLLDERASWFYEAVGAGPAMAPKRPGPSSAYLSAYKDKAGEWLDGGNSYRLRVPTDPPIKLFWSVTLYDVDTRALIVNEQKIADRSSRMGLRKNEDGSVYIYTGPEAPAGFEKNWIPTVPGKNWFAYFRFYQPTERLTSIGPGHWRTSSRYRPTRNVRESGNCSVDFSRPTLRCLDAEPGR